MCFFYSELYDVTNTLMCWGGWHNQSLELHDFLPHIFNISIVFEDISK